MAGVGLIRALLEQATAQGSRSTAMKPLGWLVAMLLTGLIAGIANDAPHWLTILMAVLTAAITLFYATCYCYLLLRDRDALRSERFFLQKLAIERGLQGDSLHGVVDMSDEWMLLNPPGPQNQVGEK